MGVQYPFMILSMMTILRVVLQDTLEVIGIILTPQRQLQRQLLKMGHHMEVTNLIMTMTHQRALQVLKDLIKIVL